MTNEWTPIRISALIALWNEGLSTSMIGNRLGITKNAVVGKVHRLGLPKRNAPVRHKVEKEVIAEVIKLEALRPGMCSWPFGEPGTSGFGFCGQPAAPDRPYCTSHCSRAYVKITKDGKKVEAA